MNNRTLQEEAARCLLCADAPCTRACQSGDPARALRAIRFGNGKSAAKWLASCTQTDLQLAEKACIHYDAPIRIREVAAALAQIPQTGQSETKPDLSIDFCGIHCEHPFCHEQVRRTFDSDCKHLQIYIFTRKARNISQTFCIFASSTLPDRLRHHWGCTGFDGK